MIKLFRRRSEVRKEEFYQKKGGVILQRGQGVPPQKEDSRVWSLQQKVKQKEMLQEQMSKREALHLPPAVEKRGAGMRRGRVSGALDCFLSPPGDEQMAQAGREPLRRPEEGG